MSRRSQEDIQDSRDPDEGRKGIAFFLEEEHEENDEEREARESADIIQDECDNYDEIIDMCSALRNYINSNSLPMGEKLSPELLMEYLGL